MPIVDVLVPQMGEGLQEVLLVERFKQPGERVARDEPFYSMETDKATLEVESPYDGVLIEWLADDGAVLPIGAPICRIETAVEAEPATAPEPTTPTADLRTIPPRTRAYAREKSISDETLATIPAQSGKLMPADIDAFLAATPTSAPDYTERPLSPQDKTFIFRLRRSAELVIPAVAKRTIAWEPVRTFTAAQKQAHPELAPSAFNAVAFAIAQAARSHPKFRSALVREESIREYAHLNLGIAVARPNGELVTAAVPAADTLGFLDFVRSCKAQIEAARGGQDQAQDGLQLLLTYMGPYELTDAVPVLVAPAVGVLFIGSTFPQNGQEIANIVLSFDHRLVHGVEAAEFLRSIARNIEKLAALAETGV